jgi:hypothetical protein
LCNAARGRGDAAEHQREVDAAVTGREGREPSSRLLQLPLAPHPIASSGLVPGNGDVHETLKEVLLRLVGGAPGVFECLVGGEELALPDQLEPVVKCRFEELRLRP